MKSKIVLGERTYLYYMHSSLAEMLGNWAMESNLLNERVSRNCFPLKQRHLKIWKLGNIAITKKKRYILHIRGFYVVLFSIVFLLSNISGRVVAKIRVTLRIQIYTSEIFFDLRLQLL